MYGLSFSPNTFWINTNVKHLKHICLYFSQNKLIFDENCIFAFIFDTSDLHYVLIR